MDRINIRFWKLNYLVHELLELSFAWTFEIRFSMNFLVAPTEITWRTNFWNLALHELSELGFEWTFG